jgi:hypothetical protein
MSAFPPLLGHKRTSGVQNQASDLMSMRPSTSPEVAQAEIIPFNHGPDVFKWHLADVARRPRHVRFEG